MIALFWFSGLASAQAPSFTTDAQSLVRQSQPRFPTTWPGSARCLVKVDLDERGHPTETVARGCPSPFAESASRAVAKWRWKASILPGASSTTLVVVNFARQQGDLLPVPARCEWKVAVQPDGSLYFIEEAAHPCAMWLPAAADPALRPEAPIRCRMLQRSRDDRDLSECPEATQALGLAVLDASFFGKAEETVVDLYPASAPDVGR